MYVFCKSSDILPKLQGVCPVHFTYSLFPGLLESLCKWVAQLDDRTVQVAFEEENRDWVLTLLDMYEVPYTEVDPLLN